MQLLDRYDFMRLYPVRFYETRQESICYCDPLRFSFFDLVQVGVLVALMVTLLEKMGGDGRGTRGRAALAGDGVND
jgi:hypothetical protein